MIIDGKKKCCICNELKSIEEFSKSKNMKDGLQTQCKECIKAWYEENKEKVKEQKKAYREANKEKHKEQTKAYYEENKEKVIERSKAYYEVNKEKVIERSKAYYEVNKEKIKEQKKAWYKTNKEQIKEQQKAWQEENKEQIKAYREANKERKKEQVKAWHNSSAKYSSYIKQLKLTEEVRKDPDDKKLLQIQCKYCREWFNPTNLQCQNRIKALNTSNGNENNLYCSEECKQSCPIFKKQLYREGENPYIDRPYQTDWANIVKDKANHTCEKCEAKEEVMYAHHIIPVKENPLLQADIDNGICLCYKCHNEVHQLEGCTLNELRSCKKE